MLDAPAMMNVGARRADSKGMVHDVASTTGARPTLPNEILTELILPPPEGRRSAYMKLRRRGSFDFPVLGVAVAARMDGDVVREARIVLGAVASLPRPAERAAAELVGQRLTRDLVTRVADLAAGPSKPLDNTDFTHPYRKRVTRVFVARALAAIGGLGDGGPASEEVA